MSGLSLVYEHGGCTGVIRRKERTNIPSVKGCGLVLLILAVGGALGYFVHPFAGSMSVLVVATMILGGTRGKREDTEQDAQWVFATRVVERPFSVRDGMLTFDSQEGEQTVHLDGASVEASPSGVLVVPVVGDAMALYWDDPDPVEIDWLARALGRAAADIADPGSFQDVPAVLRGLREKA